MTAPGAEPTSQALRMSLSRSGRRERPGRVASDAYFDAGNAIQPIGPGNLGNEQGDWMLAAAALSATAAVGFLYMSLKKPIRGTRKSARRGEQKRRRR